MPMTERQAPTAPPRTFTVSIEVREEDLIAAITAGMIRGPYGYGYWCEEVRAVRPDKSDEDIARRVLDGGRATFKCFEDDGRRWTETLTRAKLLRGFGLWLSGSATQGNDDGFEIDAAASDLIMQFALFGKIVYG